MLRALLQTQSPSLGRRPKIRIVACEFRVRRVSMSLKKSFSTESMSTKLLGRIGLRYWRLYPTMPYLQYTAPSMSFVPSRKAITLKFPMFIFPRLISSSIVLYVFPGLGIILQLSIAFLSKCHSNDEDKTSFSGPTTNEFSSAQPWRKQPVWVSGGLTGWAPALIISFSALVTTCQCVRASDPQQQG